MATRYSATIRLYYRGATRWRELFRLAGLPVGRKNDLTWHDLLRHDIKTTARYITVREERVRAVIGKMGNRGVA